MPAKSPKLGPHIGDMYDSVLVEWMKSNNICTLPRYGNDQWHTRDRSSKFAKTMRLTADVSLIADQTYLHLVEEYAADHAKFDSDFANAWFKLVHRSEDHPHQDDLEKDAGFCTSFEFLTAQQEFLP